MSDVPSILKKIIEVKREEIKAGQAHCDINKIIEKASAMPAIRPFRSQILSRVTNNQAAVIAELKKASPSRGIIRDPFDPIALSKSYEIGGATCLSVLTDEHFFQGHNSYVQIAKSFTQLPVLRKDFIIDPWQLYESRVLGSDCILLIVAALTPNQLNELYAVAISIGLDVLIEVHNEEELALALPLTEGILGINNRNLHTFETNLSVTYDLLKHIPDSRVVVTESGILKKEEVATMFHHNVKAFLVGESFMRTENPGVTLSEFFDDYL